jgi:hypothetical protein
MGTPTKRSRSFLTRTVLFVGSFVVACGGPPRFAGYDVTDHNDPSVKFHFSPSDATSASPVVVTPVPDTRLASGDDWRRLDLEKTWLSVNCPKTLEFVGIGSAVCNFKMADEHAFCEVYDFEDPKTHKRVTYYFYVGNWPVAR